MSNVPSSPQSDSPVTPAGVAHLEKVIYERILDVFATFLAENWRARTLRLADTSPATLASEIAGAVSAGVLRHLDTDPQWATSPQQPARADEAVLTAVDVDRWGGGLWYQPAAAIRRLIHEATKTPGWPYMWVVRRLSELGVLVKLNTERPTPGAIENLVSVSLRRDGSATARFSDGTTTNIGPAGPDQQMSANVVREGKVDSYEGHYLTIEELESRLAERESGSSDETTSPAGDVGMTEVSGHDHVILATGADLRDYWDLEPDEQTEFVRRLLGGFGRRLRGESSND